MIVRDLDKADVQVMQDYLDDLCERCEIQRQVIWAHPEYTVTSQVEELEQ